MGARIKTIAFPRANRNEDEVKKIVSELINAPVLKPDDFYPEINIDMTDSLVIINKFPAIEVMENTSYWEPVFSQLNISNDWLVVFVYITSSDYYGYSIYEKGKHLRTFAYYEDFEVNPLLVGLEQPFEIKYLHQSVCYLNTEDDTVIDNLDSLSDDEKIIYTPALIIDNEPMDLVDAYSCLFSECSLRYLDIDIADDYLENYDSFTIPIENNAKTELKRKLDEAKGSSLFSKILKLFK